MINTLTISTYWLIASKVNPIINKLVANKVRYQSKIGEYLLRRFILGRTSSDDPEVPPSLTFQQILEALFAAICQESIFGRGTPRPSKNTHVMSRIALLLFAHVVSSGWSTLRLGLLLSPWFHVRYLFHMETHYWLVVSNTCFTCFFLSYGMMIQSDAHVLGNHEESSPYRPLLPDLYPWLIRCLPPKQ